jgi:hypothetical protein
MRVLVALPLNGFFLGLFPKSFTSGLFRLAEDVESIILLNFVLVNPIVPNSLFCLEINGSFIILPHHGK